MNKTLDELNFENKQLLRRAESMRYLGPKGRAALLWQCADAMVTAWSTNGSSECNESLRAAELNFEIAVNIIRESLRVEWK